MKPIPVTQLKLAELDDLAIAQLPIGLVGTVVETYDDDSYLVEFSDSEGCEYAMATLKTEDLLVLHLELTEIKPELAPT